MNVNWLIEKYIFDENLTYFKRIFKEHNINYKIIEYFPFMEFNPDDYFSSDEKVIFYGSLNLSRDILKKSKWIPGVWCNLNALKCSNYYNYYGKYLLNKDYIMLPYGEMYRQKEFLFKNLGINNSLFVRPDDGFKSFTGQVISYENYEIDVKQLGFYDVDASNIVIVSSPKNIKKEIRFICIDGQIVTGSINKLDGKPFEIPFSNYESDALIFAQNVVKEWQPELCFTLDVALYENEYKLLEINSFSCSGFYQCDIEKIVLAANKAAIKEYNSYLE